MRQVRVFLLCFTLPCFLFGQVTWFRDDFHRSEFSPGWTVSSGQWKLENNAATIATRDYDQLLASSYYLYASASYSLEVSLKGTRSGLFFSLDDTASKALSHMVRFDEKSILTGYFDAAGIFNATNTFDLPLLSNEWRILRVDVDPMRKRYDVFVDGRNVGTDTVMVFASGYFGLQASDGAAAFQNVRIEGNQPPQRVLDPAIGTAITFEHLSYVEGSGGTLRVYLPELHKLVQIGYNGAVQALTSPDSTPGYAASMKFSGRTYIIRGNKIFVYTGQEMLADSISDFLVRPACMVVSRNSLFVADPGARSIFQFSSDRRLIRTIDARSIGGFKSPRGLAALGDGQLAIADYDRIVFWSEQSGDAMASISDVRKGSATLQWQSDSPTKGWAEIAAEGEAWTRLAASISHRAGRHRVVPLKGLKPLTRYNYRYFPALRTIPESSSISKTFRFTTAPQSEDQMAVVRLPILCLVYRTICYRDKYPAVLFPGIPDGRTLTDYDLEYLRQAAVFNRDFFFRNSSCRLSLDFDFYVVEDTLWLHEVGDLDPYWLGPNERVTRDFEIAAKSFKRNPGSYAGLICPYAWANYPPRRTSALRNPLKKDTVLIRQAVGGGTYGVPAPWKYGKTTGYTGNPFQDRFSRQDWLITHEFHHQIDALMDASGFPEYYHADQPWKMPGRFGEDFDFNAQIIRNIEATAWLALRFGVLTECNDGDRDGVPDDDPTLPFDERKLGSNPSSRDSDSDGVFDLAEVMMGTSHGSDPLVRDTDADGLSDRFDPEPLYPIAPVIPRVKEISEWPTDPFGSVGDSVFRAAFRTGWTESALLLSCSSDKPVNLLIQLDADNDGWFHGFDNFQIRVLSDGDSARVADFYLRNCSSRTDPPHDRRDILKLTDIRITFRKSITSATATQEYQISLAIPRNERYGLSVKPGEKIGIRFGAQTSTDLWVWNELFERNYMMQVTLR